MSVPHPEALELPIMVERTTQRPHARYVYIMRHMPTLARPQHDGDNIYIRKGIYRCLILDHD